MSCTDDGSESEGRGRVFAEDLTPGHVYPLGSHDVTLAEVVEFARRWDPLPMHTDEQAGARGHFGGVIGSGIHTIAIFQRLAVQGVYERWEVVAGRSLRDVQLTAPLRPGSVVSGSMTLKSLVHVRPDRSLVTVRGELHGDGQIPILSLEVDLYVGRRP